MPIRIRRERMLVSDRGREQKEKDLTEWHSAPRDGLVGLDRLVRLEKAQLVDQVMKDGVFLEACRTAGIEPTRRQASKWLDHEGLAWTTWDGAMRNG